MLALHPTVSWRQGDLFAAPYPFDDRPFQHVDEGICIVPMVVLHSSGRILHGEHQHLSSGYVDEILLHDGDHNWLRWFGVHSRCELCACENQRCSKKAKA